uniref:Solute carrier family 3 member 2 N-terminal domain-containing protein n=2 Tax=Panagrolaimus sp. PS1159 TaxID=55785 RepID=A0AC35F0V6_9BILA
MSAGESLMPSTQTEDAKAELGIDAQFSRDADNVAVTTAPVVVGLTKEELEHYRNDPKYKVLRWALFILFWLTWVALFAAAIVLIVMSPRVDVNADTTWYKVANTYEIFVPSFKDSDGDVIGDFKGIEEKLEY